MSQPSIKKNYIYNMLYEILAIITPIITAPYVSRIFEADGVGIYSRTNATTSFFVMFAALGIRSYGQREIAQHRDDKQAYTKIFWELEIMCICTTLVCLVGWGVLVVLSGKYSVYYAVLSLTIIATAFDISWFWGGHEQYKFIVIRNSLIKLIGIAVLFIFVKEKKDLLLYITLVAVIGLIGNISMWSYLPRYLGKVEWKTLKVLPHLRNTFVYFIPTIATSIYTLLDKVMIGWITHSDFENGYYEQATKIISICKTVVFSLVTVMSARMSFLFSKQAYDEIKRRIKDTFDFVLFITIPIMFGLIGVGARFIPLFFGEGYENSIFLLYLMSPLLLIICISNVFGALYFTPSGQRARSNKAIIAGSIVNLIFNLALIPFISSVGATVGSIVAELTITIMYLYMSRDFFEIKTLWILAWKRFIASFVMLCSVVGILKLTTDTWLGLILQIMCGAVVYFVMLFVLRDRFIVDNTAKVFRCIFHKK